MRGIAFFLGFVASLPRPGGNITGVMQYEATVTGKWLAMLKEIAPGLERAAFVANPEALQTLYRGWQVQTGRRSKRSGFTAIKPPRQLDAALNVSD